MKALYKFWGFIKQDKNIIITSLVLATAITALWSIGAVYSQSVQNGIADKVVRFHILANSDSDFDQALKLRVRDKVLEEMSPIISKAASKDEARILLQESFPKIRRVAEKEIQERGYDYDVKVSLARVPFPVKQYGDITFPAGVYDALRVEIGEAAGQNWWCVMFPPMCFVDAVSGEVTNDSKEKLRTTLSEEEYTIVTAMDESDSIKPVIKFKIVEWWQEYFAESEKE